MVRLFLSQDNQVGILLLKKDKLQLNEKYISDKNLKLMESGADINHRRTGDSFVRDPIRFVTFPLSNPKTFYINILFCSETRTC